MDAFRPPSAALRVDDVLITNELKRRASRPPDAAAENQALHAIAAHAGDAPDVILLELCRAALELCDAGTAGVSLLEREPARRELVFRWAAVAGALKDMGGATMPRALSPSGTCLDRGEAQLFRQPARFFTALLAAPRPIVETLVIPFTVAGDLRGTLWVATHDERRALDGEDLRVLTSLTDFAAALVGSVEAERTTRTTVERLRRGIETAPMLVVGVDDHRRVAYFNRECEALTGYARDQVMQQELLALLVPPAWHAALAGQLRDAPAAPAPASSRSPWITKAGEERLIEWRWFRESSLTVGLGHDVTAEARAADEREKLTALVEHCHDFIAMTSADGDVLYLNRAGRRLIGLDDTSPVVGTRIETYVAAGERARIRHALASALGPDGRWHGEILLDHPPPGDPIPVEWQSFPALASDGRTLALCHVARDLTERESMERARRTMAAIVESSSDAIIGKTLDGIVTSWNRGAERLYGFSAQEMIGRSLGILMPPDTPDELAGILRRLARGERVDHYETSRVRKDRQTINVALSISPIEDRRGAIVGAATIARDITARRRSEAKRLAQHAIARLLVEADTVASVGDPVLDVMCAAFGWDVAELWLVDDQAGVMRCAAMSARPTLDAGPLQAAARALRLGSGVGLPGRVWKHARPEGIVDLTMDPRFVRRQAAVAVGLRSGFAFPLTAGVEPRGVIAAFTCDTRAEDEEVTQLVSVIGHQIGLFIERLRANDEVRHREEVFRSLSESSPLGIYMTDGEGRNTYTNVRCLEILGVDRTAILDQAWGDLVFSPDRDMVVTRWQAAVRDGYEFDAEFRWQRPDASVRWVRSRAAPVKTDTGRLVGYVGTLEDVTERERASVRRDIASWLVERIWRGEPLHVVLTAMLQAFEAEQPGTHGLVLLSDETAAHLDVGAAPSLPPAWVRTIAPAPIVPDAGPWSAAVCRREPVIVADVATDAAWEACRETLLRAGLRGTWAIPILASTTLGVLVGFHRSARPSTAEGVRAFQDWADVAQRLIERHTLEQERNDVMALAQAARVAAEQANRAKDDVLGILSHELRTPLNAVVGWASVIGRPPNDSETIARATAAIQRNAKALGALIDDLLDVSRIVAGKLELTRAPVDLSAVVAAAVDSVRFMADSRQIVVHAVSSRTPAMVLGDAMRLEQVAINLLNNAVKFSPPGGRVSVRVEVDPTEVRFAVEDEGAGITPEFLPHVFERFTQGPASIRQGLGLGLAIVRHVAELHEGQVSATSPGAGQGATFTVALPRLDHTRPLPSVTASLEEPVAPLLIGVRLLLVEDDADSRVALSAVLSQQGGADVTAVGGAVAAVAAAASMQPDVIVSDIIMDGKDGYELLRELRQCAKGVPVIALTALTRAADRRATEAAGFALHLTKPIDSVSLVQAISSVVAGRRETG